MIPMTLQCELIISLIEVCKVVWIISTVDFSLLVDLRTVSFQETIFDQIWSSLSRKYSKIWMQKSQKGEKYLLFSFITDWFEFLIF